MLDDLELSGERDLAIWSLDQRFAQRRFAQAALDRIAGGTYVCCLRCDEEISMKRLTALPHAFFCLTYLDDADHESTKSRVLKELAGIYIGA